MVQNFPKAPPLDPDYALVRFYPGSAPGFTISVVIPDDNREPDSEIFYWSKSGTKMVGGVGL